ncbi:MAG: polysaccharide pyruvyl transferase family protein [Candidatus Omnitrophica bacterium]|jgi:hypothetical protein|nr:polysaccharide pyruvyl transferase family protein [Candidatus Omnitrophota bacterium]
MKAKNLAIITTLNHNIGDDFVREGILYLLEKKFGDIKVFNIHKHIPITVRKEFEWIYSSGLTRAIDKLPGISGLYLSKVLDSLPIIRNTDKILNADILVQSGAPVYWCHQANHCADNEWYKPLIIKRYMKIKRHIPFLDIAAGSCQAYFSDGYEFVNCDRCASYIREIHNLAQVTTIRDKLAKKILNSLGLDAPVIPCPSIFASARFGIEPQEPRYVCLNYMRGGGHYDFDQNINISYWERTFSTFYNLIKDKYDCVFVCHNQRELQDAKKIDHQAKIFISRNHKEYLRFYAQAKCGVVNRVHAAFAIAGFGRPSFVIGSDSRIRMVEEIGLRHAFVSEVDAKKLLAEFEHLLKEGKKYQEAILGTKRQAYQDYMAALEKV